MTIRVSVVVAVYNTGEHIEPLIASLLGQTMPREDYELIFIDDGSTDGTPARLDRLAAEDDRVTVRHEPNSGWPGRPRNLGTDLARGTYVFYADHDDWFGLQALQRMADYADAHAADVLIGRYAGHRRGVAKAMFDRSRPAATLADTPLMDSLTPHKLFRRAFLAEHGLRFPEGRRRLEDHVFVVAAYFAAARISVLADYHCYFHIARADAGNAGYQRIDPPSYYGYVREVVDIVLAHTDAGPLRERCLRRPLRQEILGRLDGAGFLAQDEDYQRSLFAEGRALTLDLIAEPVDRGLSPPQRVRAALLRAGRFTELLAYVEHQVGIRAAVRLTDLWWDTDGCLVLDVEGSLVERATGDPVTYRREGAAVVITVPDDVAGLVPSGARDCTADIERGTVQLVARRRADSEEWPVRVTSTRTVTEADGQLSVHYRGRGRLDPLTAGGGRPLTPGIWDLYAKVNQTGWTKEVRLGSVRSPAADRHLRPALLAGLAVVPYWTETYANLSLNVAPGATTLAAHLRGVCTVQDSAGSHQLNLELALATLPGQAVTAAVRLQLGAGGGLDLGVVPLVALPDTASVTVPLDGVGPGDWRVLLGLDGAPAPLGWVVRVAADGSRPVVAAVTAAPAGAKPVPAPARAASGRPAAGADGRPRTLPIPVALRRAVRPLLGRSTRRLLRRAEQAYLRRRR